MPRHLVHRAAITEVLITDWRRDGPDRYRVAAQWPRAHSIFRVEGGAYDTTLFAETLRQSALLLSHEAYQVPQGHRFLMRTLSLSVDRAAMVLGQGPGEAVADVVVDSISHTRGEVSGFTVEVEIELDGLVVGRGRGTVRHVTPQIYERLRWRGEPREHRRAPEPVPALDPRFVGVTELRDVVVGPQLPERAARALRVVVDHPVHFDHPLDHVPGMLVIEALRQTARADLAGPGLQVVWFDLQFPHFLDLDRATWCQLTPDPDASSMQVRVGQDDTVAVHGRLGLFGHAGSPVCGPGDQCVGRGQVDAAASASS